MRINTLILSSYRNDTDAKITVFKKFNTHFRMRNTNKNRIKSFLTEDLFISFL